MLEIDHLFAFVDAEGDWASRATAAGWVLDDGIAHEGQGTRNRRLWLPEQYLELVWVESRDEAAANPLRLDRRAEWRVTGACPIGIGLHGELDDATRSQFWPYRPAYAHGGTIWIHHSNEDAPAQPFVFAFDATPEMIERYRPRNRHAGAPHLLAHARPASLREVRLALPAPPQPLLAAVTPRITWRPATAPHLEVVVGDGDARLELSELVAIAG